jgi:hypothetical protein
MTDLRHGAQYMFNHVVAPRASIVAVGQEDDTLRCARMKSERVVAYSIVIDIVISAPERGMD